MREAEQRAKAQQPQSHMNSSASVPSHFSERHIPPTATPAASAAANSATSGVLGWANCSTLPSPWDRLGRVRLKGLEVYLAISPLILCCDYCTLHRATSQVGSNSCLFVLLEAVSILLCSKQRNIWSSFYCLW